MATITPTLQTNPTTMAANWSKGVTANAQKWLNKYLNPKAAFNANPQQSQAAWTTGIQAAQARNAYATGLQNADLTMAANNASTFGVTNYAASGTNKAAKYSAKAPALAAAINQVRTQVEAMPKGGLQNGIARATAWATGMSAYKGKI
jgi:acyl CoA:acetate/3-ketoacid CoA transferase alpha subunit